MSAAAALPPPSRKCPRCRDVVPILVDDLCLGCDSLIPDRETQVTEMVQNRGNTSAYVGGGGHLSLPSAEGVTYKPHAPQPPPRKAVINLPGRRPSGRGHRTTCSRCGVEQGDPAELVKGVCAECRATAETKFTPEHELPPIAPEVSTGSPATLEGEPADDTLDSRRPSRPAPSAEHDGYEWPTNSIGQPIPPPPQAPRPVPAWHHEALQLLIATEGHDDPAVKAARKVVANSLVKLNKALMKSQAVRFTSPPADPPMKRRWRRIPPAVVAEIVRRYQAGESTGAIGQALDVSGSLISRHLKQQGVEIRPRGGQPGNHNAKKDTDV